MQTQDGLSEAMHNRPDMSIIEILDSAQCQYYSICTGKHSGRIDGVLTIKSKRTTIWNPNPLKQ